MRAGDWVFPIIAPMIMPAIAGRIQPTPWSYKGMQLSVLDHELFNNEVLIVSKILKMAVKIIP